MEVDLTEVGRIFDATTIRQSQRLIYVFAGLGIAIAVTGMWTFFFQPATGRVDSAIVLAIGLLITGYSLYILGDVVRAAVRLRVDAEGVQTWGADGRHSRVEWADPKLKLIVYAWPLSTPGRRAIGLEGVEYRLDVRGQLIALMDGPTQRFLVATAAAHGVPVSDWLPGPPGRLACQIIGGS